MNFFILFVFNLWAFINNLLYAFLSHNFLTTRFYVFIHVPALEFIFSVEANAENVNMYYLLTWFRENIGDDKMKIEMFYALRLNFKWIIVRRRVLCLFITQMYVCAYHIWILNCFPSIFLGAIVCVGWHMDESKKKVQWALFVMITIKISFLSFMFMHFSIECYKY